MRTGNVLSYPDALPACASFVLTRQFFISLTIKSQQPDDPSMDPSIDNSIPLPWEEEESGRKTYKSETFGRSYLGRERSLSPKASRMRQKVVEDEMAYREDLFLE